MDGVLVGDALTDGASGDGVTETDAEVVTVTVAWEAGPPLPPQALTRATATHAVPDLNHLSAATSCTPSVRDYVLGLTTQHVTSFLIGGPAVTQGVCRQMSYSRLIQPGQGADEGTRTPNHRFTNSAISTPLIDFRRWL